MDKKLTILLVLKDKTPFTWRWMNYANHIKLPFKVLIADGGKDQSVEKLKDKSLFPNVDYEYLRYPYDENFTAYWKKMADATSLITTPYTMKASNDDFLFVDSIRESVRFLDENPDYSTARGEIYGFEIKHAKKEESEVFGTLKNIDKQYHSPSITTDTATERIRDFCEKPNSLWHDVHRTEELKETYKILSKLKIEDLSFAEYLMNALAVASGKAYRGNGLYMLFQRTSGSGLAVTKKGPFDWVLSENWPKTFFDTTGIIAQEIALRDKTEKDLIHDKVMQYYLAFFWGQNMVADYVKRKSKNKPSIIIRFGRISNKKSVVRKLGKKIYFWTKNWKQKIDDKKKVQTFAVLQRV